MKIRLLRKSDIKAAAAIVGKNYNLTYQKIAAREIAAMFERKVGSPTYIVAEENKKIIGLAGYINDWADFTLYNFFWVNVAPDCQNQGVGKKLIDQVVANIKKEKDARHILISTKIPNYYRKYWRFKFLRAISKGYKLMILDLK